MRRGWGHVLPCLLFSFAAGLAGCADDESPFVGETSSSWTVASPDGQLALTIELARDEETGDTGVLQYRVQRAGRPVLQPGRLGIETDRQQYVTGLRVVRVGRSEVRESYTMPVGKRRARTVGGNQLTVGVRNENTAEFEVIARVHDDGIGIRYRLLGHGSVTVTAETTSFALPENASAFMAPYSAGAFFLGSYELAPAPVQLGAQSRGFGWAFPALFELPDDHIWMLISEADLDANYCGTRLHEKPERNVYRIRFPVEPEGQGIGDVEPHAALPFATPWRALIIGDLRTVVESTLIDDLSRPSQVASTDWVRPGRVAWSWWSQETGDPDLQREYIDFAAEMGWEYVLIDARWDQWPDAENAVRQLVAYAAEREVSILLWYNSAGEHTTSLTETPLDRMLEPAVRRAEMQRLMEWGVAGIKVDFFESDKQDRIQQYLDILQDAAAHRLMVNFHGSTIPRGWQRTYPHLMTQEAVRGAEFYKFPFDSPTASTNVLYVFGRNVIGSMDYTPVTFEAAFGALGTTHAHQLALPVLFESGWQHLAERADANPEAGFRALFAAFPFARDFLMAVPTVWDDTRLLSGNPRSHVVLARRHGADWFVAGINGTDEDLPLVLPLSFLPAGTYDTTLIRSGDSAEDLAFETAVIAPTGTLPVTMRAWDGFVVMVTER